MTQGVQPERGRAARIGAEALAEAGVRRLGLALVDFSALRIEHAGVVTRMTPKAMCVLLVLARQSGRTLSRDQIMDQVWAGEYPVADVLSHAIKELRRALADPVPDSVLIQTVPRVGYRLTQALQPLEPAAEAAPTALPVIDIVLAATPARMSWRQAVFALLAVAVLVLVLTWNRRTESTAPASAAGNLQAALPRITLLTPTVLQERSPTLSPDGLRLAYVLFPKGSQQSRIRIVRVGGTTEVEVATAGSYQDLFPQWSHHGDRLAYESIADGQCTIMIAEISDLTVTAQKTLGACPADYYDSIEWAEDDRGLWLARTLIADSPSPQLLFRDLSGVDHPLAYDHAPADFDSEPRLSPDGRWIVFRRGLPPAGKLFLVSRDGGKVTPLMTEVVFMGRADWYPDSLHLLVPIGAAGQRLLYRLNSATLVQESVGVYNADAIDVPDRLYRAVFEVERARRRMELWQRRLAEPAPTRLAPSPGNDRFAAFAPDGQRIAFVSDRSGSAQVWMLDTADAAPRRLTDLVDSSPVDPAFSADGGTLVFAAANRDRPSPIMRLNLEAGAQPVTISLAAAHVRVRAPQLLPNGGLAYLAETPNGWAAFLIADLAHAGTPQPIADLVGVGPGIEVAGDALYLHHLASGELRRSTPPYLSGETVFKGLPSIAASSWRIIEGALWYVGLDDSRLRAQLFRSELPGTAPGKLMLDLGELQSIPRITLDPAATTVLLQQSSEPEPDIGSVELPPP